jgi:hypothetical protein
MALPIVADPRPLPTLCRLHRQQRRLEILPRLCHAERVGQSLDRDAFIATLAGEPSAGSSKESGDRSR